MDEKNSIWVEKKNSIEFAAALGDASAGDYMDRGLSPSLWHLSPPSH
ncbi:hypothetical protein FITA111629_03930 [Filibacter tadaridae]|uniref:Uncharacterized protein n=1 Tax=Filibacter tadaridae TaxID=2483811 RepID=A0A3P5XD55_9BACL|nr:hypothetical protein [Filibacter tadaridae]VDC32649.1 hypothetical protein FILTAD_02844 [Filibacter tadaridae]